MSIEYELVDESDPDPFENCRTRNKESTRNANAEGKEIRFYWLSTRGHKGNERADELAKSLPKRLMPIMIMRKFPYPGHTGIAEYLHRFKLLQSPSCECDADKIESVWHIILECPRYEVARYDLEHKIETKLENQKMHEIMENPERRVEFLSFAEKAFREATSRHRSMNRKRNEETPPTAPTSAPTQKPQENPENEATTLRTTTTERMLRCAETAGKPGIRTRGVALFMDENTERLGIGFEAHERAAFHFRQDLPTS
ncbi:hypothetical protein EVAR_65709_1 [Eumeta japonica]|uniref:Retrovirus-related Pol polyprotein from type-1 retrotransposable element R1 4 n=1 Tax=Eumeta variegata TaxID=151549 RepID=A0A4C2AB38_EUMVA|nr:hypothetical protein EVAR_65709_1 [Eumeta japonica]